MVFRRMRTLIVIPARNASTRFPGKPLALIAGRTLIERVYSQCVKVRGASAVVVATDHAGIRDEVASFGGQVMMTRRDHRSGTDRVAEVARKIRADLVVNVQGDEPLLQPRAIEFLIDGMKHVPGAGMGTLANPIREKGDFFDPNVVKVVVDSAGRALYFSRAPIPHDRSRPRACAPGALRHVGIYAYRASVLQRLVRLAPSRLERLEKLEQLRALENGVSIQVFLTHYDAVGVDVPADVRKVERLLAKRRGGR
jgi:3-deoxy-manno-octulosonate cytidylyltransferase (CMP-KDO synthetase)